MTHTNDIITYSQSPKALGGIYIKDHTHIEQKKSIINHTHRDDYYVISIVTNGEMRMDCEMETFTALRITYLLSNLTKYTTLDTLAMTSRVIF